MESSFERAESAPSSVHFASIGSRFLAVLIDGAFVLVAGAFATSLVPVIGGAVVWFFYAPILESSALQATIGKRVMGLQVVDLSGNRLALKTALIRNVMKIVSSAICMVGYVFAFFSVRKQALHDLVAETVVIYGRSTEDIADAWADSVKSLFRFQSSVFGASATPSTSVKSSDVVGQLERLKAMRDRGELTEDEFQAAKAKVLRG